FIRAKDWPSSSPDLNPLDYDLWLVLESTACSKRHDNLESLKKSVRLAVNIFPMERVRASIDIFYCLDGWTSSQPTWC
ncbi:hypothetical protein P3S23_23665, partial [Enterobacter hormaechei]